MQRSNNLFYMIISVYAQLCHDSKINGIITITIVANSMTLFVKDDNKFFHVHIPRTGGRYIKEVLKQNEYQIYHDDWEQSFYGISIMHLHYPLYEMLDDVSNSNQFTIVRNPFTRFASSAHCMIKEWYSDVEEEIYTALESKSGLEHFIEYHAITKRYNANWMRPQKEFISEKTFVYKYEDKLGKNFIDWFNKQFNANLEHKEYSYYGDPNELLENKIKKNKKIESLIKDYYREDYEFFDY